MTDHGARSYHRYLQGDKNALEDLVREYGDRLVRFSYCILGDPYAAEDVMEDTFAALIVKKKGFVGDAKFSTYLFQIARNRCMDVLRRRKKLQPLPLFDVGTFFESSDPEAETIDAEEKEQLYKALRTLPEDYQTVLDLVYFEGFSIEQTAEILHKNKKQVYNLLSRAKSQLRTLLEKEPPPSDLPSGVSQTS